MDNGVMNKKRLVIFGLSISVFILFIVLISLVVMNITKEDPKVSMLNEETLKDEGVINNKDIDFIKSQVRELSKFLYGIDDDTEIVTSIRESTYKEKPYGDDGKYIEVVVDVETTKASYFAEFEHEASKGKRVMFSCLPSNEAKYPEAFCMGSEGHSSIDSTLGDVLPYRKMVNGSQLYKLGKRTDGIVGLTLEVQATCDDDAAREKAKTEVKELIHSYGLDPEQVPLSVDPNTCKAYEDMLKINSHGMHHM